MFVQFTPSVEYSKTIEPHAAAGATKLGGGNWLTCSKIL